MRGQPGRRPLTYDDMQALFDAADGRVSERVIVHVLVLDATELTGVDVSDWLAVAPLDTHYELRAFATWVERIGSVNGMRVRPACSRSPSFVSATAITD